MTQTDSQHRLQKHSQKPDSSKKKSKGLKRNDHKSRMSLMHFGRKDSSSDEDNDDCAPAVCAQGSILHNSVSAENFTDKWSSSNFGHFFTRKQHI
jgi:hypothetical protein